MPLSNICKLFYLHNLRIHELIKTFKKKKIINYKNADFLPILSLLHVLLSSVMQFDVHLSSGPVRTLSYLHINESTRKLKKMGGNHVENINLGDSVVWLLN